MLNSNTSRRTVKPRSLSGKTITLVFAILFAAGFNSSQAQGTWIQKADFEGGPTYGSTGFSIGNQGYIQMSVSSAFWQYSPDLGIWTQKANFGGNSLRLFATGFSIGNKGYLGTGGFSDFYKDFWEYDPNTNVWTQKSDFGGDARWAATGFSIGNKGYIGTGADAYNFFDDFWEYDPNLDIWTQRADYIGGPQYYGIGFGIGSKGYIGTGFYFLTNTFYEYDPAFNTWTQKASFGGTGRGGAVGFSNGSKGYIGTGQDVNGIYQNDFWEYDPATNVWTQKAVFEGTGREFAVGFSIGIRGYVGTGITSSEIRNDFWEYTPDTSLCSIPTNISVTNITSSSAKLNWDAVAGAEGYKVRYKVSNISGWTTKSTTGTSKTINGLSPNTSYKWEVKTYCQIAPQSIRSDWSSRQSFTTGSSRVGDEVLQQISFQIYPNPAQDHATIQFILPQSAHVYIKVYDVSGKEIETLLDGDLEKGDHSLPLNILHFSKRVYLVKMISDFGIENQKLIVL